jgi:hypothetical protein
MFNICMRLTGTPEDPFLRDRRDSHGWGHEQLSIKYFIVKSSTMRSR